MSTATFPDTVFTLWLATVVLALVVFVPLAVYSLYRLLRTAWSIRRYAADAATAAKAIAASTGTLPALDDTIAVATDVLKAAEGVAHKLDAVAGVLETRAARLG